MTTLAEKLQLREGQPIRILGAPPGFRLDARQTGGEEGALLVFASSEKDLKSSKSAIVKSARADRLTWVAYPKAGQKGTDLNRDILAQYFEGIQGVRMVSIDDIWSALRLRPTPLKRH